MLPRWTTTALAKTKATLVVAAAVSVGAIGGTALAASSHSSHAKPTTVLSAASTTDVSGCTSPDPETCDAGGTVGCENPDPETCQTGGTVGCENPDPEACLGGDQTGCENPDPETCDSGGTPGCENPDPETCQAGGGSDCPPGMNHGQYVSSVARSAPHGRDAQHGKVVSAAARSDCGKPAHGGESTGAGSDRGGAKPTDKSSMKPTKPAHPTHPTTGRPTTAGAHGAAQREAHQPVTHGSASEHGPSAHGSQVVHGQGAAHRH